MRSVNDSTCVAEMEPGPSGHVYTFAPLTYKRHKDEIDIFLTQHRPVTMSSVEVSVSKYERALSLRVRFATPADLRRATRHFGG